MKSTLSLQIFLMLFFTFGLVVPSYANQEISTSQTADEIEVQIDRMIINFNIFLYNQVIPSSDLSCKLLVANSLEQTQIGHIISEHFLTFSRIQLETVLNMRIISRLHGMVLTTGILNNVSEESFQQAQTFLQNTIAQTSPEFADILRQELEDMKLEWKTCINRTFSLI